MYAIGRIGSITFALMFIINLGGCGSENPRVTTARKSLADYTQRVSDESITLTEFEKTGGKNMTIFGMSVYEMAYTGTIQIQNDCYWVPSSEARINASARKIFEAAPVEEAEEWVNATGMKKIDPRGLEYRSMIYGRKGDTLTVSGNAMFEKHEQGWKLQNIKVSVNNIKEYRKRNK